MSTSSNTGAAEVPKASTDLNGAGSPRGEESPTSKPSAWSSMRSQTDVFLLLLSFRLINALTLSTFFQPDEYFQSLEPAWRLAFGKGSGAWITWEWNHALRSALHPAVFAPVLWLADFVSTTLKLSPKLRSDILLAAPKILQGVIAASGDYYTWRLASLVYGESDLRTDATLALSIISPWQWFVSTRTFSNCAETTLTVAALANWPWKWAGESITGNKSASMRDQHQDEVGTSAIEIGKLRITLTLAAIATILRPTNIIIWLSLTLTTFIRFNPLPSIRRNITFQQFTIFLREAISYGVVVLAFSSCIDRLLYEAWVFPPYNFLYFNVVQSLAMFYGNNNWHYYLSQGYPLLLTTSLPFAGVGFYRILSQKPTKESTTPAPSSASARESKVITERTGPVIGTNSKIMLPLATICLALPLTLSIISHKEVRFIYPILPALHIIAAAPAANFFAPILSRTMDITIPSHQQLVTPNQKLLRQSVLALIVIANVSLSFYISQIHNSGIIYLTNYLREEYQSYYSSGTSPTSRNMTVGMLMPCHSTPWRSHLQNPPTAFVSGIEAWALTCEPPLDLNAAQKASYLDEADQFYASPLTWLKIHMSRSPPTMGIHQHEPGIFPAQPRPRRIFPIESHPEESIWRAGRSTRRPWPEYIVIFAQLENQLAPTLVRGGYAQCERIWNSGWHDDWRRTGDVVVWCLYPERSRLMGIEDEDSEMVDKDVASEKNKPRAQPSRVRGFSSRRKMSSKNRAKDAAAAAKAHKGASTDISAGDTKSIVQNPFRKPEQIPLAPAQQHQKVWWERIPGLGPLFGVKDLGQKRKKEKENRNAGASGRTLWD